MTEGDGMSQAFDGPASAPPADTATARIVALARARAADLGDGSDRGTILVLACMLRLAASGVSTGFLRLAPEQPVALKLDDRGPVE